MKIKQLLALSLWLSLGLLCACNASQEESKNPTPPGPTLTNARTPQKPTASWQIDTSSSLVEWRGKKVFKLIEHFGTLKLVEGQLLEAGNQVVGGRFVVDMTSIIPVDLKPEGRTFLINSFSEPAFFDIPNHPTAILDIKEMEPFGQSPTGQNYKVLADLTIKGITRPIDFEAIIDHQPTELMASASFTIDRTLWDVRFDSGKFYDNLGDQVIADEIPVKVVLFAYQKDELQ